MRDLDRLFIDHPEFRRYFYEGATAPKNPLEQARLEGVCEYILDVYDFMLAGMDRYPSLWPDREYYETWMGDIFRNSPTLCAYLDKRDTWYNDRVKRIKRNALKH